MNKILIVGGAGYIGSHTVKYLQENNYDCIVVDNLSNGTIKAIGDCNFEEADLMDIKSLDVVFSKYKIDSVIHFAGLIQVGESVINPEEYYQNNVVGTLNLLSIMRKYNINKIIFSSSAAVYGNPEYLPIDEEHPTNPINPYGMTKLMIEKFLSDYHKAYGLKYIALRYFNACGCDRSGKIGEAHKTETHLIPLVLKAIIGEKENIKIFGDDYDTPDGTCLRDYIHVEDLAMAHGLALESLDKFCGVINLGTSQQISVKQIIETAEKITGKKCTVQITKRRTGDPAKLYASNNKAKNILGWIPKITNIDEIIQSAWNWEINRKF